MAASVEEWIEALRSGMFRRTEGTLEDKHGCNCCLGVYCKISGIDFNEEIEKDDWEALEVNGLTPWISTVELQLRFGPDYEERLVFLGLLNDCGFTFEHIANFLEADDWPENLDRATDNLAFDKPWS